MIEHLATIEQDAHRDSPVHRLDARVKILIAFAAIIAMVAVPYSTLVIPLFLGYLLVYAVWWGLSRLPLSTLLWRYLLTLPFGLFIIIFQIFFENPYYDTFTPLFALPLGITIYVQSVEFAAILAMKFTACIIWIILLSSTTPMEDLLKGGRRLGLPSVMALSLGMMIRYLFVFADMFANINRALALRHFAAFDRALPYRYRLTTLAYAIGSLFLRSYEQGERTYICMQCRGYGKRTYDALPKRPVPSRQWGVVAIMLAIFVALPILLYVAPF